MSFQHPIYLLLLLLIIPIIWWYVKRSFKSESAVRLSSLRPFDDVKPGRKVVFRHIPFVLRVLAITLLIIVIARPQKTGNWEKNAEGIDIVLALDISQSMLAEDLKPNRLSAAVNLSAQFINDRPNDNIGLVVFSGESFTQCPLTLDHATLINMFKEIKFGALSDGTAIGLGLTNAVSCLKAGQSKSKVIILLTDGINNMGNISPETAAELAKKMNIRVYTIGVGTEGLAPFPFKTPLGVFYENVAVEIDETLLRNIAQNTGGLYFRATDNSRLQQIYMQIDTLEKTKLQQQHDIPKEDVYLPFALFAGLCLLLELILRMTVFRKIP
jgi:Ca-activated chloride channel family protein